MRVTLGPGHRLDMRQVVARAGLAMRPGENALTAGNGRQQCVFLCGAAAEVNGVARHHHRRPVGFEHQRLAQSLHHQQRVDRRAAKAAVLLCKGQAEQAHFGKAPPHLAAEALVRGADGAALLKAVFVREKFGQRIGQHGLFFGECEIHLNSVNRKWAMGNRKGDSNTHVLLMFHAISHFPFSIHRLHSPSTICAMILRCTSFEPP